MSDLAATNCGCGCETANNNCGCGNNIIWIILLLSCCGGWGHNGCGLAMITAVSGSFFCSSAVAAGVETAAVSAANF